MQTLVFHVDLICLCLTWSHLQFLFIISWALVVRTSDGLEQIQKLVSASEICLYSRNVSLLHVKHSYGLIRPTLTLCSRWCSRGLKLFHLVSLWGWVLRTSDGLGWMKKPLSPACRALVWFSSGLLYSYIMQTLVFLRS